LSLIKSAPGAAVDVIGMVWVVDADVDVVVDVVVRCELL
jgi:hypothetical protein